MGKFFCLIVFLFFIIICSACKLEGVQYKGGPYYFAGWKSYKIPFEPIDNISLQQAKQLDSYYEAHFDDTGRIILFKKFLHGNVEWSDKYFYDKNRMLQYRIMSKHDGTIVKQYFDKNGRIIVDK